MSAALSAAVLACVVAAASPGTALAWDCDARAYTPARVGPTTLEYRGRAVCNVRMDSLWGKVTIYPRRQRIWEVPSYRASIRIYNEYCHLVTERPLSECLTKVRRAGTV